MVRTARHGITAALLLLATTACDTTPPVDGPLKSGTGEVRTDLAPLARRFPLLAKAEQAEWMSGTLGDDRVPGPSTYWIDAIVTLPEPTVAEIGKGTLDTTPPEVAEGLRGHLPHGPFRTSESLDDAFSSPSWSVTAYLAESANTVVLVARGQ